MSTSISPLAAGLRVGVANYTSLGTVVARVRKNTYSVKLDDGRVLSEVSRSLMGRWDDKARRCFNL